MLWQPCGLYHGAPGGHRRPGRRAPGHRAAAHDADGGLETGGDIPGFMEGYWQSDSLVFIGRKGPTYGWQPTLNNYRKSYPDAAAMGQLDFSGLRVTLLAPTAAQVVGRWHLARPAALGDAGGYFLLVLRQVDGQWKVVADHTNSAQ